MGVGPRQHEYTGAGVAVLASGVQLIECPLHLRQTRDTTCDTQSALWQSTDCLAERGHDGDAHLGGGRHDTYRWCWKGQR